MTVPDRLHVMTVGDRTVLADEAGRAVAFTLAGATARRLVALWNACRGIETEALEAVAAQPDDLARIYALARIPFPSDLALTD
jgi:hypothetical protein